jgi:serine/threonine protein kinase
VSRQPTASQGKRLGRYRIERELGRGGMGVVYLAEDENTQRLVALKTTAVAGLGSGQNSRNQRRQRFIREVQALTNINHENVVHVFDAGESDDPDLGWLLFYSMDFVDGLTLAQLVQQRGPLDPKAAAAVVLQVASGLGAAHQAGIVHRDVKPANIFISNDGRALIGDFGICKIEGSTQITRRDQLVGTPNYLAPEQILGEEVSASTDVFALGALFYVITMNRPLRQAVDPAALLKSAQGNEPKERMLAEKAVPEPLRRVIARCLERDPKKRWPDGRHLAEALAEHASRVPSLADDTSDDPHKNPNSTADRSNPFSSSGDQMAVANSGDVLLVPGADANAVEAAARALLGEVADRFGDKGPTDKKGDKKSDAKGKKVEEALPVARTESTVMFNLRAMEEADQKKAAENSIPVARTESTAIFRMREGGGGVNVSRDERRLDDTFVPEDTHAGDGAHDGPVDESFAHDRTPAAGTEETRDQEPRVRTFEPPRVRRAPRPNPLAAVPRSVLLAATGVVGMLCGLGVAMAMAPDQPEVVIAPARVDQLTLTRRPTICPDVGNVADADRAKAQQLVREAIDIKKQKGGTPREAVEKAMKATELNPYDKDAFYTWATMLVDQPTTQKDAYVCVCLIAEGSSECQNGLKALGLKKIIPPGR